MGIKGAILGDIIGSKWEFCGCKNAETVDLLTETNFFTDDTILSCATKYALDNNISFAIAYKKFAQDYSTYARAGWGANFANWIYGLPHRQSIGNGSAMRVAYIGEYATSLDDCETLAVKSARTTHDTIDGIRGAVTTAVSVYSAGHGYNKDFIMHYVNYLYPQYAKWSMDDYRKKYSWSELCKDSVHLAVRAFYESDDYESCLRNVLSVQCDTDTVGAIAGGIAGSFYGEDGIYDILVKYLDKNLLDVL